MKKLIFIFVFMVVFFSGAVFCPIFAGEKERMEILYNEGVEFYKSSDFHGAANKWEEGYEIATKIYDIEWQVCFAGNLGIAYKNLGEYLKAFIYNGRALKIMEDNYIIEEKVDKERIGNSIEGKAKRMETLYNEGTELYNHSDFYGAAEKWEEGLKIARGISIENAGAFIGNLGLTYSNLQVYEKAITYCEESLEISKKIGDKQWISSNLGNLGSIYGQLANYLKAIFYIEQALEINKEIGYRQGISDNLTNLGNVCRILGDKQKAIFYYEQSLKIDKEIGDTKGIGDVLTNMGNVYQEFYYYQDAISYYERALKIHSEIEDKKGIGSNLSNLGVVYNELGDYQKAIFYYKEALKMYREIGDKKGAGNSFSGLGIVYCCLGDYQKAISFYEESLIICKTIDDKKGISDVLANLGTIYKEISDYQKAISYYEDSLEIEKEIGVPTGTVELNIADVYLETGELEKAEKEYLRLGDLVRLGRFKLIRNNYYKAIECFDKVLNQILEFRNAKFLFAVYCGFGEGHFGLKNHQKAKENYEKAIILTEEEREALGEGEKAVFFSAKVMGFSRTKPYEGMVRVGLDKSSNYNPEEAFYYSENIKARVLAEAISKGKRATMVAPTDFELAEEEEKFIIKIRGLRKEMEALYRNKAMDIYAEKEKELKKAKTEQEEFIARLRKSHPEYASLNYPQPIRPQEVKLNENEVLIAFEVTEEKLYVFLLEKGRASSPLRSEVREVVVSRKELQEMVLKYRGYFEGIKTAKDLLSFRPETGKELYSILFGTMLDDLGDKRKTNRDKTKGQMNQEKTGLINQATTGLEDNIPTTIIIVPDEILGILPFDALVTGLPEKEKLGEGEFGPFPLGIQYLGDKYTITYAQSATSLTLLRTLAKEKATGNMALAVCDPIFSENDFRFGEGIKKQDTDIAFVEAIRGWKTMGIAGIREKGSREQQPVAEDDIFPRLEKTELIGKGLKNLFGDNATVLTGQEASEEKVVKLPLEKYKYITFATHGILDKAVPYIQEPALVLSQVGNTEGYDGFLTMSEVMGLKIPAEVVALTACETGLGKNISGEGVMGMGRAFQYAGCGNILMSLWPVAEDATVALSNEFFKALKEGKEPKEAIREARAGIRKAGYEHPFFWSAFVLVSR